MPSQSITSDSSSVQAGEEAHLPVSYYDDDGDGVVDYPAVSQPIAIFWASKMGTFGKVTVSGPQKMALLVPKSKFLRPLL